MVEGQPDRSLPCVQTVTGQTTRDCHHKPTRPRTDSTSFCGSYPMPCLNTVSTFLTAETSRDGSPSTTTRSACLLAAIVPTRASRPRYFAPLNVAILIA